MLFSRVKFLTFSVNDTEKYWLYNLIDTLTTYPLVHLFNYIMIPQLLSEELKITSLLMGVGFFLKRRSNNLRKNWVS